MKQAYIVALGHSKKVELTGKRKIVTRDWNGHSQEYMQVLVRFLGIPLYTYWAPSYWINFKTIEYFKE